MPEQFCSVNFIQIIIMKILFLSALTLLISCSGIQAQVKARAKAPVIANGIQIKATGGFKIRSAKLSYAESGEDVPPANTARIGQKVNLLIEIEEGWKVTNGRVRPGASEKIVTNTGSTILNEDDLFASLEDASAEDARYITLNAVITSMTKKISYFIVSFRVWDKDGPGRITGSYRLKIR